KVMLRVLSTALAGLIAFSAAAADRLPLPYGYYVAAGTPCAEASNFSTYLLTRDSLRTAPETCRFRELQHDGGRGYDIAEQCEGQEITLYKWVIDSDGQGFLRSSPGAGEARARYCPQGDLPEPWRSNDIGALINQP